MRTLRIVTLGLLLGFCFVSTASAQKTCDAAKTKLERFEKKLVKKTTSFERKLVNFNKKIDKQKKKRDELCGSNPEATPTPVPK